MLATDPQKSTIAIESTTEKKQHRHLHAASFNIYSIFNLFPPSAVIHFPLTAADEWLRCLAEVLAPVFMLRVFHRVKCHCWRTTLVRFHLKVRLFLLFSHNATHPVSVANQYRHFFASMAECGCVCVYIACLAMCAYGCLCLLMSVFMFDSTFWQQCVDQRFHIWLVDTYKRVYASMCIRNYITLHNVICTSPTMQ